MKTIRKHLATLFAALALATVSAFTTTTPVHAADAATPAAQTVTALAPATPAASPADALADTPLVMPEFSATLIVLLTPLIIAGIRKAIPHINPSWFPVLAMITGCALSILAHYTAGLNVKWWQGILLGAGGVGLREFCDRLKQEIAAT